MIRRRHGTLCLGWQLACALVFAAASAVQAQSRPSSQIASRVTIRSHQGAPTFFIDGKPEPPVLIFQTVLTTQEPVALRRAGYRLFSFVGNNGKFGMDVGWAGEGRYDYAECDAALSTFARLVPDGYCIPRVLVSAPPWWVEKHPEEAVRFASGAEPKDNEWGGTRHESFASQRWRREAGEALRRFVRHVLDAPYADRVAGIHVAGGIYGEWHNWSAPDMPDTSEPMRGAFAEYTRRKYGDEIAAVQRAWGGPLAGFDAITIPTLQEQHASDLGMFRDPAPQRRTVDYYESLHAANLDAIEHFCRIVKDESRGRLLTMALYGYLPDLNWPQAGDHRAGPRALRSPVIDILASPHTYGRRRLGQDGLFRHFPAADVLHGKMFLDEADDRTHLAPPNWPGRYARNAWESVQLLRREFANAITRGVGLYYMDQSGTFFSDPALIAELGRLKKWADQSMSLPRTSAAEVAVITSLQSEFYVAGRETGRNHISLALYEMQIGQLCRSGAPFDLYHLEDLAEGRMPSYKVYVMLDCGYLTDRQRAVIEKLKTAGRTVLWFYAPGFVTEQGLSLEAMQKLTGMSFEQLAEGTLQVALDSGRFAGSHAEFGEKASQSPVFVPMDKDVEVYGREPASGRPAFVARSLPAWRSVYCLTPAIPARVLRQIFARAGVHIYCDKDDILSVGASWIAVHAATAGKKTIRLRRPSPVYDICAEQLISESATEFETEMAAGQTNIWMLARP